jgi:hypothetical protein
LPHALNYLDCSINQLQNLPQLSDSLYYLDCDNNNLYVLPALPDSMSVLFCSSNPNLHCLPHLGILTTLLCDYTDITCLPNIPTGNLQISPSGMPLCTTACIPFGLGVYEANQTSTIAVYPNPNNGTFILQTSGNINSQYIITDMLGNVIAQQAITSGSQTINMLDAAVGVYTLVVKGAPPIRFVVVR